jgi:hypothetical protein
MGDFSKVRQALWANVEALMLKHYNEINITRLAREAKIGGSASRIKAAETSVGLDVVYKVAKAFRVAPHQLLMTKEDREEIAKLRADLATLADESILRITRIYRQTDDEGRRVIDTAAQIAEARHGRSTGMGKPRETDHR